MNALAPLTVATDWGRAGATALAILFCALAGAGFAYVRVLRRERPPALGWILVVAALGLAAAAFAPVVFSSDVYAYAAYGEMARLGINPYAHSLVASSDDLVRAGAAQWNGTLPICVYGPLFVALAEMCVRVFAPLGMLAQLNALRALACAALLSCVALAYCAYEGDRNARLRAAATLGLNPVALWCAAEGHNDAIALAAVLGGFALMARRWIGAGAVLVALSALIKPPGAVAALPLLTRGRARRWGAAAGLALAAAGSLWLVAGIFTQVAPHGRYAPQASVAAIAAPFSPIAGMALALGCAASLLPGSIAALRAGDLSGWIRLGLAGWVLIPNPYPWYATWLLALAALAPRSRAGLAAIALSFTALLRYIPDAVATPGPLLAVALGVASAAPLLLLWRRGWYNERPA